MRELTSLFDPGQAHLLRSILETEGIEAVVMGEPTFMFMGSGLSLRVVDDSDYDRALGILRRVSMGLERSDE